MHKFLFLLITITITTILPISIAEAQGNISVDNTNSTSKTTVVDNNVQNFRVGPTVSLRPLDSQISSSQDGIVELFLNNPSLNDCTLEVDLEVSVPSNIYIYAQDGGMSGGAGTVTGHFTVPSGSSRTITLHIKGSKEGTYPVHFSGMYWPGNNKDKWNPISLDNSFSVLEASPTPTPTPAPTPKTSPGLGVASMILIFLIAYCFIKK